MSKNYHGKIEMFCGLSPALPQRFPGFRLKEFQGARVLFNVDGTYGQIPQQHLSKFTYRDASGNTKSYINGHKEAKKIYESVQHKIQKEIFEQGEAVTKSITREEAVYKAIWKFLNAGNRVYTAKDGTEGVSVSAIGIYANTYTLKLHGIVKFAITHGCNVKLVINGTMYTMLHIADMFNNPIYQDFVFPSAVDVELIKSLRESQEATMWQQVEAFLDTLNLYALAKMSELEANFVFMNEAKARRIRALLYNYGLKWRLPKGEPSDANIAYPLTLEVIQEMIDYINLYKVGFGFDINTFMQEHYHEEAHQFDKRHQVGAYVREYKNELEFTHIKDIQAYNYQLNAKGKRVDYGSIIETYGVITYFNQLIEQGELDPSYVLLEDYYLCPNCGVPVPVTATRCSHCEAENETIVTDFVDMDDYIAAEDFDIEDVEYDATFETKGMSINVPLVEDDYDYYTRKYGKEVFNSPVKVYKKELV